MPYVCVCICVCISVTLRAVVLLGLVPGCSAGLKSEASQRKPRTRFTARGLDEAKVLFGLKQPFPHCLSSRWRCHFLNPVWLCPSVITHHTSRCWAGLIKRIMCSRLIMGKRPQSTWRKYAGFSIFCCFSLQLNCSSFANIIQLCLTNFSFFLKLYGVMPCMEGDWGQNVLSLQHEAWGFMGNVV